MSEWEARGRKRKDKTKTKKKNKAGTEECDHWMAPAADGK